MPDATSGSLDENPTVRYEETLAIRDDGGAGRFAGWVRIVIAFLVVNSLLAVVLVVIVPIQGVATRVGGMGLLQTVTSRLVADQSTVVAAFAVAGVLSLLVGVAFVWSFVRNVGRTLNSEVHIRVSDEGVSVEREGSQYWQSSGVDVPFDAITAVEYVDPEASSFRVELGDFRAPKFFAGRSRDWVRLERARGPAVYVGSDRPQDLAEAIAQRVPGNVTARPF